VVFVSSKPLNLSWAKKNADALLCCFNPGAQGGTAVAEILTGAVNPSGRLSVSFPRSAGRLPVYYNGYRGWHSMHAGGEERYLDGEKDPLFAFGEGLSYTAFEYSELRILTPVVRAGEDPAFEVSVANVGERAGIETVQLYVRDLVSSVTTPAKNLRAFARVALDPGERKTVRLSVSFDELAIVSPELERVVEPGEFMAMVGPSSRDADLLIVRFSVTT